MTRDMGKKYGAISKNGKLFVADFSDFFLAVNASKNDAKYQKPNSFIRPMTRDMGKNMLPAVKTENFLSLIFLIFICSVNEFGFRGFASFSNAFTAR